MPLILREVEASRISRHSIGDDSKVVRPILWLPLPSAHIPGNHFSYRLSWSQGNSAARRIMSMKSHNDPTRNQTSNLPACSAVALILAIFRPISVAFRLTYKSEPVSNWLSLSLSTFTNSSFDIRLWQNHYTFKATHKVTTPQNTLNHVCSYVYVKFIMAS